MAKLSVEQRRITHRGRTFHFVSYEGQPANPKRQQEATGPAWFLMLAGKRWEVMPHIQDQDEDELTRLFTEWLDEHAFA
jgi:hypothetical protein